MEFVSMKRQKLVFAAALILLPATAIAGPWKSMDTSAGEIYTNANGMALYTYDKDEAGKSNCYDQCAQKWPPFAAAEGAENEDEWTVIERTDGTKMWAYEGKPLYTYAADTQAGEVNGDGAGGVWHVVEAE